MHKTNLPQTILLAGLLVSGFSFSLFANSAKEAEQKPDILLIMPDQWRGVAFSILGCAGVITPQLAHEGALFRRVYTSFNGGKPVLKSTWDEDGNLIEKETF
jgi:hypothetical protein